MHVIGRLVNPSIQRNIRPGCSDTFSPTISRLGSIPLISPFSFSRRTQAMSSTNGVNGRTSIRKPNPPVEDSVFKSLRLDGRTVIVTGGCGGIGYEVSRGLAEAGANVSYPTPLQDPPPPKHIMFTPPSSPCGTTAAKMPPSCPAGLPPTLASRSRPTRSTSATTTRSRRPSPRSSPTSAASTS